MASDDDDHTTTYLQQDPDEQDLDDDVSDQILDDEQEDVDLIDDDDEEEQEHEHEHEHEQDEEDDSTSSAAGDVTIAVTTPTVSTPIDVTTPTTTVTPSAVRSDTTVDFKKPLDDSRRLFQRLWTDEDEIELLQGFLDYITQRGTNNSHHHDTTAFYDQIKGKLQLDFNKNQLVEKLRRLKKKYRNVIAKTSAGKDYVFKSPHDQAAFELSCKIWSEPVSVSAPVLADGGGIDDEEAQNPNPNFNSNISFNLNENNVNGNGLGVGDPSSSEKKAGRPRKRSRAGAVKIEEGYNQPQQYGQGMGIGASNANVNVLTPNLVEETVKSCLLPLFKELVNNSPNGGSGSLMGPGLGLMNFGIGDMSDEKWRKQHIMELEVYSKRLELMQDQVNSRLEELRSMGNS